MTSVIKNGQPSMEEILASIRRIVADDPSGVSPLIDLNRKPLDRNGTSGSDGVGADDSPDFELPSMFRSENDSPRKGAKAKSAPIGRLTDAIRNVGPKVASVGNGHHSPQSQSHHTANTQSAQLKNGQHDPSGFGIRPKPAQSLSSLTAKNGTAQPLQNGNGSTMQNGTQPGASPINNGFGEATKDLNGNGTDLNAVHHIPQSDSNGSTLASAQTNGVASPTASTIPTSSNQVQDTPRPTVSQGTPVAAAPVSTPRVMAPFRDTRMSRMAPVAAPKPAQPTQATAAQPANAQTVQPQQNATTPSTGIGAIVPGALDLPGRGPAVEAGSEQNVTAINQSAQTSTELSVPTQGTALEANPPPLPEGSETGAPSQIEDATADLLRPMLRQWLSDNMPRMVEKALHIEVAETVRTGKPTESS